MLKWLKKRIKSWALDEPYIDVLNRAIDGTPLSILETPRGLFSTGSWKMYTTNEGIEGTFLVFSVQKDFEKAFTKVIEALDGKHNNILNHQSLAKIAEVAQDNLNKKEFSVFKHVNKPYMEFVKVRLTKDKVKVLETALENYYSTKQKS